MSEKLKKIEIEAFRIYDEKQTFDFTNNDGEIANLVVIYAPNGYGKTSFFDAVEWSLTGNIKRFHDNPKIKQIVESEQGVILKNYDTHKECGTVRIVTENENVLEVQTQRIIEKYRKSDFKEGKNIKKDDIFERGNFKEFLASNILGQDKIDAFLRFTSPKERYEVLKKFWDSEDETKQYQNLINALKIGKKKEDELQKQIKSVENEINTLTVSNESIRQINNLIKKFNSFEEENLEYISVSSEEKIIKYFVNKLLELKSNLSNNLELYGSKVNRVKEILLQWDSNEENRQILKDLESSLKSKRKHLESIDNYYLNVKEIGNINASLVNLYARYSKFKVLNNNMELFRRNLLEIENKEKEIYELKQKVNINLIKRIQIQEQLKEKTNEISTDEKYIQGIDLKKLVLLNLEEKQITYNKSKQRFSYFENKIIEINNKRESNIKFLNQKIVLLEKMTDEKILLNGNFDIPLEFSEDVKNCRSISNEIFKLEEKLETKNREYKNFGEFNDNLNQVINLGRKIIKETSLTSCPLCKQEYNTYSNLLNQVDYQIGDLFGLKTLETEVNELENQINKSLEQCKMLLDKLKLKIGKEKDLLINILYKEEVKYKKNLDFLNKQRRFLEIKRNEYEVSISNHIDSNEASIISDIKSHIDFLTKEKRNTIERIQSLQSESNSLDEKLGAVIKELDVVNYQIEILEGNKSKLESNPNYIYSINLMKDLQVQTNIKSDNLNYYIKNIKKEYKELNVKRNNWKKVNLDLKNIVENNNVETLNRQIKEVSTNVEILKEKMRTFNKQIFSDFETNDITKNYAEENLKMFTEHKGKYLAKLDLVDKLIEYTNVLERNILRNKTVEKKNNLEFEIKFVKLVNKHLSEAVSIGKDYISKKINEAFNVKSINTIYQRIDPHPEMKIIKFESNFNLNKPEINIYAQTNEENRAPVLYFSAAQLNLVSLSIFLARALESEKGPLNTIFMDDPVQHLDGLNVLSFIDILRSITTYKNRQVIISTHNETLFNLIKRKIDPMFTKSKYIKLGSFGEIKQ